ncbi:hypothetical protein LLL8_20460 [Lactococcus lactis]|nr:hypothetical protein LLL8_20460 [Lactococcus lactis]
MIMNINLKELLPKLFILLTVNLICLLLKVDLGFILMYNIIFFASLFYFQRVFTSRVINIMLIIVGIIASCFAIFVF